MSSSKRVHFGRPTADASGKTGTHAPRISKLEYAKALKPLELQFVLGLRVCHPDCSRLLAEIEL
jgi:hypothetical protein